ncbi:hypothetical protein TYRP_000275 [Tyrophagus putrescentiae]|nr:hypothetical protein TYRP_000275 [Tyrophagus putrescentiae]
MASCKIYLGSASHPQQYQHSEGTSCSWRNGVRFLGFKANLLTVFVSEGGASTGKRYDCLNTLHVVVVVVFTAPQDGPQTDRRLIVARPWAVSRKSISSERWRHLQFSM